LIALVALLTAFAPLAPAPASVSHAPLTSRSDSVPGLELHFFDVGQGDAVLIRAPDGRAVLYDGGESGDRLLAHLERVGVTSLELVIASHNHADHIGGLAAALERYRPRFVLENGIPHTTRTYERFLRAVADAGSQLLAPSRRVILLEPVRLTVIPPPGEAPMGHNDNSVGLLIEYGEFRATLLGDSGPAQQHWWIEHHGDLLGPVHVHKASHHGSARGDTPEMLRSLRPAAVVIGAGADNRYGHPTDAALALYRDVGATVYRTDRHGSVTVEAGRDGVSVITFRPGSESERWHPDSPARPPPTRHPPSP
jgi:competence protein ComEC